MGPLEAYVSLLVFGVPSFPESHRLYISSLDFSQGATVSVIDPAAVPLKTDPKYIQVGSEPKYIAINPKTDNIYVANMVLIPSQL